MKADRAGIIIIKDDKLLVMYRKTTREYYCLPGGHMDPGETPEQTAIRELKEETTLDVELGPVFLELENQGRKETYFMAKSFSGTPVLSGEEAERNRSNNVYKIEWIELNQIPSLALYPTKLKEKLENLTSN
jgi:ADP-ribose pyrophosphatase YjhB (NUDIX family)